MGVAGEHVADLGDAVALGVEHHDLDGAAAPAAAKQVVDQLLVVLDAGIDEHELPRRDVLLRRDGPGVANGDRLHDRGRLQRVVGAGQGRVQRHGGKIGRQEQAGFERLHDRAPDASSARRGGATELRHGNSPTPPGFTLCVIGHQFRRLDPERRTGSTRGNSNATLRHRRELLVQRLCRRCGSARPNRSSWRGRAPKHLVGITSRIRRQPPREKPDATRRGR